MEGGWEGGSQEGREESRSMLLPILISCLTLFVKVICHFIEFPYNTDQVANLKGYCLPSR
jgi:hypothetical protein